VGLGILVLDFFGADRLGLTYRLVVPEIQTFLPIITASVVVIFGFFILRQFPNYTLNTKLIISFVLVSLLSVGAVTLFATLSTRTALNQAANQALSSAAQQTAANIDNFISTNREAIRTEAKLPILAEFLSLPPSQRTEEMQREVTSVLRTLSRKNLVYVSSYALLDSTGQNVLDTFVPNTGIDESNRDYFIEPSRTRLTFISPVKFYENEAPSIYFSGPILNDNYEVIGVLRAQYRATILQQIVQDASSTERQIFGVLFDENQLHLAHGFTPDVVYKLTGQPNPAEVANLKAAARLPDKPAEELATNLPQLEQNLINASAEPFFTAKDVATEDKINQVAVAPLKTQPWQVAFFQPQEVFLAPVQNQTRITVLLAALITITVAAIAVVLGQRLANPITRLTEVAQQVTAGNLLAQAPVESKDETGQLARAFNSMTNQLRTLIGSLEEQVQSRTAELSLSMEVGQRAAALRNLDDLLPTITEFIRERFNLYYVHVYFVDDVGQNLLIKSGTGHVGQQLLARKHSLPIGPGSIVGQVAATSSSIVVPDTELSDIHKPNPLLPQTRSELAIPLVVEQHVIGVLDMQASQPNTFTQDNLTVFEAMGTQLAVAIDGAQQWSRAQEAQEQLEAAVRQLTRQTWQEQLTSRKQELGFAYDLSSVVPISAKKDQPDANGQVSVPVVVQNQPIGRLLVNMPERKTLSDDEQGLLAAVAQQLAQKAENLRLFEDTQRQAAREQLARQITDKIRASRDMETALKTAAQELSQALGVARAAIDLKTLQPDESDGSGDAPKDEQQQT